jgi:hypothetical protein
MQKREGGGNAKDRLINAVGSRQGVVIEAAAEDPRCNAVPDCRSQDQFFEELLRLPPPVGRCRCHSPSHPLMLPNNSVLPALIENITVIAATSKILAANLCLRHI